jgi:hypothetical protein
MKKALPYLLLFALACNTLLPTPAPTRTPTAAPVRISPSPTAPPSPTGSPTPAPTGLRPEHITFHPGPELYAGDIVSIQIERPGAEAGWEEARVKVFAGEAVDEPLASDRFGRFGIGGRAQATFWWVWDTAGLAGEQSVTVVIESESGEQLDSLTVHVTLLPAELRPPPEREARWAQAESACCLFHYLTGTAAARDIALITAQADEAFERVEERLGVERERRITFTLLSRLLGHGGFAGSEISLTYIDRNPAGVDLETVFVHEGTHLLDRQIARERPTLLTEGLAVFIAGGHYKPEDLDRRAAALLVLDRYLPLADLARDFYPQQHEIGYLQAGALVNYLVDNYGWEKFKAMYASFQPAPDEAAMLEAGLQAHYGKTLAEVEAEWLTHLRALPVDEDEVEDLRLTVALFDTLRRYQQLYDPAAYYLTAWLPDGREARKRGIVADFIRSPRAPENVALEAMLAAGQEALRQRDFDQAESLVDAVNAVLDANGLFFDPLAARYLRAVGDLAAQGYEAQTLDLFATQPRATAIRNWPTLETIILTGN